MIEIKVKRVSNGVSVEAAVKVNGTEKECVEEFAVVLSALRKSSPEIYMRAALIDLDIAREELEHDDEE